MKKLYILSSLLLCSLASMACGFPSLNDQLFSYTQYRSSALFGNSAYAAMQRGTGLAMASQVSPMGSFNSLTAYTPLKNYTLQLGYSEMGNAVTFGQNLSLGLSRKFTFENFAIASGIALNGAKSVASSNPLTGKDRLSFQTGWDDFSKYSNQYISTEIGTVLEYKNLTALASVNNVMLKSAEVHIIPKAKTWNAGLMYTHGVKSLKLTHGAMFNKQEYINQFLGFSSASYKLVEVGFGFKVRNTRVTGFAMCGVEFGNFKASYTYSESTASSNSEVPQIQQAVHEASLAWNLHK